MRKSVRLGALAGAAALSLTLAACGGGGSMAGMDHNASTSSSASTAASVDPKHNAADVSFAQNMIVHHQGAIAMAKLATSQASTQPVKDLASRIEGAQAPEIQQMTAWLDAWGQPLSTGQSMDDMGGMSGMSSSSGSMSSGSMSSGSMSSGADGMMTDQQMTQLKAASGKNFDRMFLEMMTTHHQGAISMAKAEQANGSNPQAIALAKSIEQSQTAEVADMSQMLQNLGA
jgi:uncharacterized protein (DUF305 family)